MFSSRRFCHLRFGEFPSREIGKPEHGEKFGERGLGRFWNGGERGRFTAENAEHAETRLLMCANL